MTPRPAPHRARFLVDADKLQVTRELDDRPEPSLSCRDEARRWQRVVVIVCAIVLLATEAITLLAGGK